MADVGAILAGRPKAIELHEIDGMIEQVGSEVAITGPIAVGPLDYQAASGLEQLHHRGKIEFLFNLLGTDRHVLEVDEDANIGPFLVDTIGHIVAPAGYCTGSARLREQSERAAPRHLELYHGPP